MAIYIYFKNSSFNFDIALDIREFSYENLWKNVAESRQNSTG